MAKGGGVISSHGKGDDYIRRSRKGGKAESRKWEKKEERKDVV